MNTQPNKKPCAQPSTTKHTAHAGRGINRPAQADSTILATHKSLKHDPSAQRSCAEDWIKSNGAAWSELVRIAKDEAAAKRRFSVSRILSMIRYGGGVRIPKGDIFAVNNNCIPALSRILDEAHPEVAPFHEKRRSECDWAFAHDADD